MATILSQALTRIAAMQKQALADLTPSVTADAVAFWPWQQEAFPYFTNRISNHEVVTEEEEGASEDVTIDRYTVAMRLIVGHYTEGYSGEAAARIYEYVPAILRFFDAHPFLTCTAYPDELDYIYPNDVQITGGTGLVVFANSGIGALQVGWEINLLLPLLSSAF